MHSIRTKTTLLTVLAIIVAMSTASLLSIYAIRNLGGSTSDEMLELLCDTGEKNLDSYFRSVEQSVAIVASYVEEDIGSLETDELQEHIDRTRDFFEKTAYRTSGVLTFYYRIDPEVSDTVKGFWYTCLDSDVFTEHEVTDISQYDTGDTSGLVWFTVPKATGEPIWLPPYITDNLDVRVISYNVPIFSGDRFVGVVGIEVDYSTMAEAVDNIRLFDNGYAFIINEEGGIIYHPLIDVTAMSEPEKRRMPAKLTEQNSSFTYTFEGVEKTAVWRPLQNGMRLVVSVPTSEISGSWRNLIRQILGASVILLILFIILTMRFTGSITKPLRDLTDSALKMNRGNYDVSLDYRGDDEVGILTEAFNRLVNYLKVYIRDLNNLAYSDALTSVKNKGAYDIYAENLQNRIQESPEDARFAIAVFDCDNLKEINDVYGHEKGDVYLKNSSHLICHVFQHSPVFRTGGDEFTVIMQNEDYEHREELIRLFEERSRESAAQADQPWKKVSVSSGIAVYDPKNDSGVSDVARRADQKMYEHKRTRKMIRE